MIRQIIDHTRDSITLSGGLEKFKLHQPVKLEPYDNVSAEMRGFYWLMIKHLVDITGLEMPHKYDSGFIHDAIRRQAGLIRIVYNSLTGEYQEELISTADTSLNNAQFWEFFTEAWRLLTQVGLQLGPTLIIRPEHLELEKLEKRRLEIVKLREAVND